MPAPRCRRASRVGKTRYLIGNNACSSRLPAGPRALFGWVPAPWTPPFSLVFLSPSGRLGKSLPMATAEAAGSKCANGDASVPLWEVGQ
eukprot:15472158-Alexandrium_andersonii.AAC.1